MKALLAIAILFVSLLGHLNSAEVDDALRKAVVEDAKTLKALLNEDWIVEPKGDEIVITSRFEVFHVAFFRDPRSPRMPDFTDETPRDVLLAHGAPKKYLIRLRYSPQLTQEDYEKRRIERQKAATALQYGTATKGEYDDAGQIMMKVQVPRYTHRNYHVFESTSDTPFARFFPPAAIKKVGGAKAILGEVLRQIPTGTDPSTG